MNLILKNMKKYSEKIKDIEVDPINKNIIATGEKLIFIQNGEKTKIISGKAKNSEKIKYIKEENQLFISDSFFVSTIKGVVLKCNSTKKSITEVIFEKNKVMEYVNFTTSGKIIYVEKDTLCSFDTTRGELSGTYPLKQCGKKGNYKIFISGENIILKYRETHENSNIIQIFDSELKKFFEIKTDKNHIYSMILGFRYLAGTSDGEIEIWDILAGELYNSIKVEDFKITYIEKIEDYYFIGTEKGDLLILDNNFKVIKKENISKYEIVKICSLDDEVFVLSLDGEIANYKIITDLEAMEYRKDFLRIYNINEEYLEFFSIERVKKIEKFLKMLEENKIEYTPSKENIFNAFRNTLSSRRIVLIGKDPYFQKGVATGRAFELKKDDWNDPEINASLKNILKLIYKTYTGKYEDIKEIRRNIESGDFKILSPRELFLYWENKGVFLINSALTTVVGKAGEHHQFWNEFTHNLLQYISIKNNNMVYLLWGKDAEIFEKDILSGDIIKHNHPAICGDLSNERDFLNGNSFRDTGHILNWTGYEENRVKKLLDNYISEKLF